MPKIMDHILPIYSLLGDSGPLFWALLQVQVYTLFGNLGQLPEDSYVVPFLL